MSGCSEGVYGEGVHGKGVHGEGVMVRGACRYSAQYYIGNETNDTAFLLRHSKGRDYLIDKDADGTIIRQSSLKMRCLRAWRAEIIQQSRNFMTWNLPPYHGTRKIITTFTVPAAAAGPPYC